VLAGIFAALIGLGSTLGWGATLAPQLALDLQGGTEIILSPLVADGKEISQPQLEQAVAIIRQRVNSTGVSEAQVNTNNTNIVVSIPGTPSEDTLKLIKNSAKLEFRPVLFASQAQPVVSVKNAGGKVVSGGVDSTEPAVKASAVAAATNPGGPVVPSKSAAPTDSSDTQYITEALRVKFNGTDCADQFRKPGQIDDPAQPIVTCSQDLGSKYLLGPVDFKQKDGKTLALTGEQISNADYGNNQLSNGSTGTDWVVNLTFSGETSNGGKTLSGKEAFGVITKRLYAIGQASSTDPRSQFAITLDGYVLSAPVAQAVITNGSAQISGNFTRESAKSLADSLKYGSLPIAFEVKSQNNISATLGASQLWAGLIAGGIGLLLVIIYSIIQYRGLASITIGSLVVAAVITYLLITILSWRQGYRLSLAGVAGLIVSIGITADSFIVYFERVKDELRDGRSLSTAVESGWKRAIRTILVSDGISLLAAIVLYTLTVGSVRGFAFTLGLTTLVDVAVVTLFTHPMLQLFSRIRFFSSGHKWSGFNVNEMKSASYAGRGEFRIAQNQKAGKVAKASGEAVRRQTIAERKAAEALANVKNPNSNSEKDA
jgi:preprotein translocase subunit SecD